MQTVKQILNTLLIAAMLATGLPLFNPEDASLSDRGLLEDAILSVQALARSTQHDGSFESEIKKTFYSLSVAASLKTIITTDNGDESVFTFSLNDSLFLIPSSCLSGCSHYYEPVYNLNISYQSFLCNLVPPPPRTISMDCV